MEFIVVFMKHWLWNVDFHASVLESLFWNLGSDVWFWSFGFGIWVLEFVFRKLCIAAFVLELWFLGSGELAARAGGTLAFGVRRTTEGN